MKTWLFYRLNMLVSKNNFPKKLYIFYLQSVLNLQGLVDKIKIVKIESEDFFEIKNKDINWRFCYREQGIYAFSRGLERRAQEMAKVYMLDLINFSEKDVVVDIGANTGDLYLYFKRKNIQIRYLGIEPGRREFIALRSNVNGECLNIGLGNEDGPLNFYYKPDTGDSSLVEMAGYKEIYTVEVKKLDTVFRDLFSNVQSIKLLKLEAEGFEPEILQGAVEALSRIEFISADLGFERGILQETTAPDVVNFLTENNFEMISIYQNRTCILFRNKFFKCVELTV